MIEPKVKGNFFERAFVFVRKKLGVKGFEDLNIDTAEYKLESWYPYNDFCDILKTVSDTLEDSQPSTAYRMGYDAMFKDPRWQSLFKGQSPKDVFGTNKRQDALFMVGRFEVTEVEDDHVTVKMALWSQDEERNQYWVDFYHGVCQGVMDITGTKGEVEVTKETDGPVHWLILLRW